MRQNKLININNIIYGLSKDFGFPGALYRPTETTNLQTGKKTILRTKYPIKKIVFFPNQLFRDYNYAALFGKDMQFGGILDATQRRFVINKKYLPKNLEIQTTDYIVSGHKRYEINKIDEMELAAYWHLVVKRVVGQRIEEIHDYRIKHYLDVTDEIITL